MKLKNSLFHFLIAVIGILLIYISTDQRVQEIATFLGALGGSTFAVGMTFLLSKLAYKSEIEILAASSARQLELLNGFDKISSSPDQLSALAGKWYCYTVSARPNETLWRLAKYDIKVDLSTGQILFECTFYDNNKNAVIYEYSALVRDTRLVIIGKSSVTPHEPSILQVFPYAGDQKSTSHAGFTFHRTWKGSNSISASLLSRKPLAGFSSDKNKSEIISSQLDQVWATSILQDSDLVLDRALEKIRKM